MYQPVFLLQLWSTRRNGVIPSRRTPKHLLTQWQCKETRWHFFVMLKVLVDNLGLNMPFWQKECPPDAGRRRKCDLCCSESHNTSKDQIHTFSWAHHVPSLSDPASLPTWCTSSWLVYRYFTTPDCRKRWVSTSHPFLVRGLQKWHTSSPCRASSQPNVSRTNLSRSTSESCVTVSHWLRSVKHSSETKETIWSAKNVITMYPSQACPTPWGDNWLSRTVLASLKNHLPCLFEPRYTKSTKLLRRRPSSYELGHLVRALHVASIKDTLCVMLISNEGRPQSRLSLVVCRFRFIVRNRHMQQPLPRRLYSWWSLWRSLLV